MAFDFCRKVTIPPHSERIWDDALVSTTVLFLTRLHFLNVILCLFINFLISFTLENKDSLLADFELMRDVQFLIFLARHGHDRFSN